jgi:O-antigen ligase
VGEREHPRPGNIAVTLPNPSPKFSVNVGPRIGLAHPTGTPSANEKTSLGFIVLAIYTFLLLSRSIEFIDTTGSLHLMVLGAGGALVLAILSGRLFRAMGSKIGLWLTFATVWMLIGAPFSVWVGGSVNGLVNTWLKSYLVFFLVAALLSNLRESRKLVFTISCATACVLLITYVFGVDSGDSGRLTGGGGTFGNSNDLAEQLLLGLPFCLHVVTDKTRSMVIRIAFVFISIATLVTSMKTGSRGALVAIFVLGVIAFWKSRGASRIALIATVIAGIMAVPFILTDELKNRYMTIFKGEELAQTLSGDQLQSVRSAMESTEGRQQLMQHAISLALHHPVFGVGFGQFQVADAQRANTASEDANWHEVHNVYLLMLAENGFPVAIAFLISVGYAYFVVFRIFNSSRRNPEEKEIARLGFCLLASMTVYFVCSNFSPSAYGFQFPILGGFIAAFDMIVTRYRLAQAANNSSPAPVWKPGLGPVPAGAGSRLTPPEVVKARRNAPVWRP